MVQELLPPVRDQTCFLKGVIKITTSAKSYRGWLGKDHRTHTRAHARTGAHTLCTLYRVNLHATHANSALPWLLK